MTSQPLRILFVRSLFRPADFGGNRYPFELTRLLAARGHDVRVVTPRPGGPLPAPTRVRLVHYPVSRRTPLETFFTNAVFARRAIDRELRAEPPDVLILSSYEVAFGNYLLRRAVVPSVYIYHSSFRSDAVQRVVASRGLARAAAPVLSAFVRYVETLAYRSADRIVAVSPFSREEIHAKLGSADPKVQLIPTGVDVDLFRPGDRAAARAALGLDQDGRVLVTVGRLMPVKRYERAIDALAHLRTTDPRYRLLVVGAGPEEPRLRERAAALGSNGAVRFEGYRDGPDLVARLVASDVQLCTSDFENWSLSLLEGLAAGVPVVGVPHGGIPQMLRLVDERLVSRGSDPRDVAEAVRTIMDPAVHAAIAARAREVVAERFSWDAVTERMEALLAGLIEDRRR